VPAMYAKRLATWEEWKPVALEANGWAGREPRGRAGDGAAGSAHPAAPAGPRGTHPVGLDRARL